MFFPYGIWTTSLVALCLVNTAFGATSLPADEVKALRDIEKTMGHTGWNFSADPCGREWGWAQKTPFQKSENGVNCSFIGTVQHVTSITLRALNLPGKLPPELIRLPFLQIFLVDRNYLSGSIPPEWGAMQVVTIAVSGNRLTGSIPKELGNISTLVNFGVESNQLSGNLPQELGSLSRLERLLLTSNNFTGEIPSTYAKLTSLKDVWLGDNKFIGKIPNFIEKWTKLNKLVIQASGLIGPIPNGIASLTNLTDLRITDLNGPEAAFPPIINLKKLERLTLRSCNIIGPLPKYLGDMQKLRNLDLSFNKFSGEIPDTYSNLRAAVNIYLTGNSLTGVVPSWMSSGPNVDLTYNNFTIKGSTSNCQQRTLNLFASSSKGNKSETDPCTRSCSKTFYDIHINCGGREVIINGNTTYEDDGDGVGHSSYIRHGTNWAISNTGDFLDYDNFSSTGYFFDGRPVSRSGNTVGDVINSDPYIYTVNASSLSMKDTSLYTQARLSPLSLTYYMFCLGNGNYKVNLHFAEIKFTDDKTYNSLGRRLFDVYIQGKRRLKDFNIEDEAGGVGKAIVKNFSIPVTDKTLEIRLYWAGKGTNVVPFRGVYGPLISAISVSSDSKPPSTSTNSRSLGVVIGIIVAVVVSIFLIVGILWWKYRLGKKITLEQDLKDLNLQTRSFGLRQIKVATNNFDITNKIGEGGFGSVYKGILADGTKIAVKTLSSVSKQGKREFVNEIGMISTLQHPHLVELYGFSIEGNQLMLIYEYMENNCLARALFGPKENQLKLEWPTRYSICVGIARGLAYLHDESSLKIVHRDIKATNILLDEHLNPKISDFGLAKLNEEDNTHISTRIAGTFGYMAPEYAMRGYLTNKADVYSFGIVVLEIVSGRSKSSSQTEEDCFYILDWAQDLKDHGNLMELVDPRLTEDFNQEEAMAVINMALLCSNVSAALRPSMSSVVSMLERRISVQELVQDSTVYSGEAMKMQYPRPDVNDIDPIHMPSLSSSSETLHLSEVGSSI